MYVSEYLSTELLGRLVSRDRKSANSSPIETWSDRELQVFELLGQGRSTQEIAEGMHLSQKTVETYRARIKEKLAVKTGPQLIQRAVAWKMDER